MEIKNFILAIVLSLLATGGCVFIGMTSSDPSIKAFCMGLAAIFALLAIITVMAGVAGAIKKTLWEAVNEIITAIKESSE